MDRKLKYVVELTDEDGFVYEAYNGSDIEEAKRIYNEFAERNKLDVVMYKKEIIAFSKRPKKENKLPKSCSECKHYSTREYRCHNEVGLESRCALGYMSGYDMRDQDIWLKDSRFDGCCLPVD